MKPSSWVFCIENAITFTSIRVISLKLRKTASDRLIHRDSPSGAILGAIQVDFVSIEVDLVPSKGKLLGEPHPRTESDSQIRHPVRMKRRHDRAQPLSSASVRNRIRPFDSPRMRTSLAGFWNARPLRIASRKINENRAL
jgi:hypothetical protein